MAKSKVQILILEDDACFREILEKSCAGLGEVAAVSDLDSALSFLTKQTFDLLLLDWHLFQRQDVSFGSALENFQPEAVQIALFTVPDLSNVISAMKSGVRDILWPAQNESDLREKIQDCLLGTKNQTFHHSYVSRLAESVTEKAMHQKTPLFEARREFSRTFLRQMLHQENLKRTDLAEFMKVSPRTLHRHLSS